MKNIDTTKPLKRGLRVVAATLTSATLFGFLIASPAQAAEPGTPDSNDTVCQTTTPQRPDGRYARWYIVLDSDYVEEWERGNIKDDGDHGVCNDFSLSSGGETPFGYRGLFKPDQEVYNSIAGTVTVEDGLPSGCGRVTDGNFNTYSLTPDGGACQELQYSDTPF